MSPSPFDDQSMDSLDVLWKGSEPPAEICPTFYTGYRKCFVVWVVGFLTLGPFWKGGEKEARADEERWGKQSESLLPEWDEQADRIALIQKLASSFGTNDRIKIERLPGRISLSRGDRVRGDRAMAAEDPAKDLVRRYREIELDHNPEAVLSHLYERGVIESLYRETIAVALLDREVGRLSLWGEYAKYRTDPKEAPEDVDVHLRRVELVGILFPTRELDLSLRLMPYTTEESEGLGVKAGVAWHPFAWLHLATTGALGQPWDAGTLTLANDGKRNEGSCALSLAYQNLRATFDGTVAKYSVKSEEEGEREFLGYEKKGGMRLDYAFWTRSHPVMGRGYLDLHAENPDTVYWSMSVYGTLRRSLFDTEETESGIGVAKKSVDARVGLAWSLPVHERFALRAEIYVGMDRPRQIHWRDLYGLNLHLLWAPNDTLRFFGRWNVESETSSYATGRVRRLEVGLNLNF